jgi:plasmid stabilization system protein ParE
VSRRRVLISADAEQQLARIRSWWRENRGSAELLDRELDAAIEALRHAARAFPLYRTEGNEEVRRTVLPRSRYALYFSIQADAVLIVAVWHTARGTAPPL